MSQKLADHAEQLSQKPLRSMEGNLAYRAAAMVGQASLSDNKVAEWISRALEKQWGLRRFRVERMTTPNLIAFTTYAVYLAASHKPFPLSHPDAQLDVFDAASAMQAALVELARRPGFSGAQAGSSTHGIPSVAQYFLEHPRLQYAPGEAWHEALQRCGVSVGDFKALTTQQARDVVAAQVRAKNGRVTTFTGLQTAARAARKTMPILPPGGTSHASQHRLAR